MHAPVNCRSKNTSFFRTAIRTFYQLSAIDSKFEKKTLEVVDKTIALAPTDAKLYYNKGLILYQLNRPEEAVVSFNQALELRPNYREAYLTLGTVYEQKKEVNRAIEQYEQVLKFIPNDPDALKKLEELKKN
ncbi:tetratricopeptide repeat protein [Candidatus Daviesbacteria bacterium]|nr:tetratricopeptide repeat protein [Candidatus Daviesbacteria bacterium]